MIRLLYSTALGILLSSQAFANGWVSSGGELFKDAKNPWFVRNTTRVTYCVQVEDQGFSASTDEIEKALKDGFEYWKGEFARSSNLVDGSFELGTQSFERMECAPQVDIHFLFGFKTLNPEQLTYLKNPRKFIGVTVRTEYDLKNLKAKGFVFFSSDDGANAYENDGSLIVRAWNRPKILRYAILHELGHVFGVPHMGSGLMSEVFLNQILNKAMVDTYEKSPIESFVRPSTELELCLPESSLELSAKWFGVPTDKMCLSIIAPAVSGAWKVRVRADRNSQNDELGEIRNVTPNLMDQRGRPVSILELGEQQTVFSAAEALFRTYMTGPMLMEMGLTGVYIPTSTKKPQPVYIAMTPTSLTITASTSNSKIEPVFIFNSPISILMIKGPKP